MNFFKHLSTILHSISEMALTHAKEASAIGHAIATEVEKFVPALEPYVISIENEVERVGPAIMEAAKVVSENTLQP